MLKSRVMFAVGLATILSVFALPVDEVRGWCPSGGGGGGGGGPRTPTSGTRTVSRTRVFDVLSREFVEKPKLAQHWPKATHLKHKPLHHFGAALGVSGQEFSGFFRQINHDGTRLEHTSRR